MNRLIGATFFLVAACAFAEGVGAQPASQRYALLVGIDDYAEQDVAKLNYAADDALALADSLARQGYVVTILLDENATRQRIVEHLAIMQESLKPEDTFVLFYAGHGLLRESNHQVYWLNYKGNPRRPDLDGLRLQHVAEMVSELPATRKLILLDHCYSGNYSGRLVIANDSTTPSVATPNPGPTTSVASREAIPVQMLQNLDDAGVQGHASGERVMFIVAASRGAALEFTEERHGIFTYVLLRALAEESADTARDGGLSITELNDFLGAQVDRMSREKGFEQRTRTKMMQTDDLGTARWQPFFRKLTQAEIDTRQAGYRERLRIWSNKGLLDPRVQTLSEELLLRWKNTDPSITMDERDERAIASMRWLLDDIGLEDSVAAPIFSERIRIWGGQ
ncbi:caspase domain protein [Lysobacter antibioticus]|uniref:caspase family protein n=1 Tax=Lysobacter antibioticus TaxID=84531 RepID=UPI00071703DB|nr:caspase family protein [Lysobacter antibioticus]ALN65496.1 caspase domain protein [Lysobacter antibioticus]